MTDYITSASLKTTLSASGYTGADDDIAEAITTASRAVDAACDRVFYLRDTSNDEVRYYSPRYPTSVEIDDLSALTSVLSDQNGDGVFETTWTLHTDFELWPDNADLDGRPWERIKIKPQAAHTQFPHWNPRSVQVTGRFGWSTTPNQVISLTRLLAVQILLRARMAPFGVAGIDMNGAVRIAKEDPAMAALIRDLRRDPLFV